MPSISPPFAIFYLRVPSGEAPTRAWPVRARQKRMRRFYASSATKKSIAGAVDLRLALGILDAELRMYIALNAPDHVFVQRELSV
jgi:hypothetical protein